MMAEGDRCAPSRAHTGQMRQKKQQICCLPDLLYPRFPPGGGSSRAQLVHPPALINASFGCTAAKVSTTFTSRADRTSQHKDLGARTDRPCCFLPASPPGSARLRAS